MILPTGQNPGSEIEVLPLCQKISKTRLLEQLPFVITLTLQKSRMPQVQGVKLIFDSYKK
jgi:hypothetical protein